MSTSHAAEAPALPDSGYPADPVPPGPPPFAVQVLAILWPAFLVAGALDAMVFAVVDPESLSWWGVSPINWSRSAVYTVTFFIFWAAVSTASAITQLLHVTKELP